MHNRNSVYFKFKSIWISLFLSSYSLNICAETIYQWSDPWGQIQYSKTPVPGAMISELTELPEVAETTEQQKKDAMVKKLRIMRQKKLSNKLKTDTHKQLNKQVLNTKNRCSQLRTLRADLHLHQHQLWQYSLFGFPLVPGYYNDLHNDLSKEIYNTCR